jgi:NCAIR mutase (PurE)-related protein
MNAKELLEQVASGKLTVEEAHQLMKGYDDLGFVRVDTHREKRQGFPEVIYGEGKTPEQIITICKKLQESNKTVLATRVSKDDSEQIQTALPDFMWHKEARCLTWRSESNQEPSYEGYIAVVCAGTTDLFVAEEAVITAEMMGSRVERIYDVGVAGIHRLFDQLDRIKQAKVIVCVAGMEGALPSVVGGLVDKPVVAVPTSIGYGANFGGLSALLSMLNTCASGVSVVNINNGFGAAYFASLIHRQIGSKVTS